jgi:hypothetical protein
VRRYDRWTDGEADPIVRPYAPTGGRTDPVGDTVLDLIAVIAASGPTPGPAELAKLSPEHRKLLDLCQAPVTVADAAADIALPLGVVRVLLSDLIQQDKPPQSSGAARAWDRCGIGSGPAGDQHHPGP